ncbi:MAG: RluA family pseudouridine synthase [Eubacteriales bacterium]
MKDNASFPPADEEDISCYTVTQSDAGKRLDVFVSECADITRSSAQRLIEDGSVKVTGARRDKNYRLKLGDLVSVDIPPPIETGIIAQNIDIDIIYQDDDVAVINKPQGMVVHPAVGNYDGTLVNALLFHLGASLSGINGAIRPGIVHRLDKNTSGLLVVAKNDFSHLSLSAQIKEHSFTRIYNAVVQGYPGSGMVDIPVGRSMKDRKKIAAFPSGGDGTRSAVTHYTVLKEYKGFSHLELRLETGRTHQIRVHMAYIGHPVLGDGVYGNSSSNSSFKLEGQCLHSKTLGFVHPRSREYMEFDSTLPVYFLNVLDILSKR